MIYITRKELFSLQQFETNGNNRNGIIFYKTEDILYKKFNETFIFIRERERNIDFLLDKEIPHTMTPKEKLMLDGEFYGYSLINFKDSKTFKIISDMDYLDKLKIVRDVYAALKEFHKFDICLGDVHLDNCLYGKMNGVVTGALIDFDEMRFNNDESKYCCYYRLRKNSTSKFISIENSNTDNIKLLIASLSLIYGINLEKITKFSSIESLITLLKTIDIPCYKELCDILNNLDGEVVYFDEILNDFKRQDFDSNSIILNPTKKLVK